jgi:hypothetical protein
MDSKAIYDDEYDLKLENVRHNETTLSSSTIDSIEFIRPQKGLTNMIAP